MEKVLVSACLLGEQVRYDGIVKTFENHIITSWKLKGRIVTICPEVAGGLPVPRASSEISGGDGNLVLNGYEKVINIYEEDVSGYFLEGAYKTLELADSLRIRLAILKEGSPSCGSSYTYDGSFSEIKKPGKGVTSALLEKNGIRVFSEREIDEAEIFLKTLITQASHPNIPKMTLKQRPK
jgi:uncharacterized protein YbbK (DUF523 family)